eukprot:CAMPEP_0194088470 /NCGR_PEP_ID=MMETSP0149-20130528/29261_1 /TAXON_ID=122233 /ORGANISM="Chaetoceros debilis, Strain MM31A-1" /LENGTH=522 /DNA_ID=CAMNT_0038772129 /DNA_START=135 /DNA_END=1703 /DNA_ORIENTATION=-
MTSEKRKSKRASKFGRKGDDRMHRSLQARLSNPKLPLLDALLQGGYHFRNDKEGNTADTDNVQLSQRRNQLSRRIRLHKQQHGEASVKDDETAAPETSPAVVNRSVSCLPTNRHVYPNNLHYANQVFARQHPVSFAPRSVGMPNSINRMRCIPAAPPAAAPVTNDVITSVNQRDDPNNQDIHHYQRSNTDKDSEIQSRALNSFRVDVASLLKKSMLSAGFQQEQTEECDEAYLAFAERALSEETRRIKRIKSKLHPVVHARGNNGQNRNHVSFDTDHLAQNNSHAYNNGHSQSNIQNQSQIQSQSQNNDRNQGNGQTQNNGLILTHDQGHNHSHDHDHSQCRPNNSFMVESSAQTTNPKRNHSEVAASTTETKKSCIHARHLHRLEGKCGHKAILHRPPNGSAHIDFLVDGKIECYQNYQPMADAAASLWPSKFSCEELVDHAHEDEETGTNTKCAIKECDKFGTCDEDGTCKSIPYDPEILQLDDIDFNCDEWNPGISEDGRSNVDDEAVLGSLLKLSETT